MKIHSIFFPIYRSSNILKLITLFLFFILICSCTTVQPIVENDNQLSEPPTKSVQDSIKSKQIYHILEEKLSPPLKTLLIKEN